MEYDSESVLQNNRLQVRDSNFSHFADSCGDGKAASNWVQQDVLRTLNEQEIGIDAFPVSAEALSGLIKKVLAGQVTTSRGRDVLAEMTTSGKSAEEVMKTMGIAEVDDSDLESLCQELLDANPKVVQDIRDGKVKAAGSLIGQAKKKNPNVNPGKVREICLKLIERM